MAKLHSCTEWSPDGRLCTLRIDSKIASHLPSSFSLSYSAGDFPGCWRTSSCSRRWVCGIGAADFYHIPYTNGVPVGSKIKLFNLPYNCDPDALINHFRSCDAVVQTLE
ncbi:hypothetical protein GOP47_0031099, partial [Adiantum capillus-veneris]